MDIKLIPPSIAHVHEMCACGRRAFAGEGLQDAVFPPHLRDQVSEKDTMEFLEKRMSKRLQSPNWHYVLAANVSSEGHAQVVGYAGWIKPVQENESEQEQNDKPEISQADGAEVYPESMDVDAYKHAVEVIERAQKEVLSECKQQKVWYLMSLGVDPAFQGRGIASKLVKWGTDKADADGLPAYLEATPGAVGLYKRCGFKEQRRLSVVRNNPGHFLTVMIRSPGDSAETSESSSNMQS